MIKRRFLLISAVTFVFTICSALYADIINVPGDFGSIQAAIDDGGTDNGDTILVADGTYTENINFDGMNVVLIGDPDNPGDVIIDGDALDAVITMDSGEDSGAEVNGFTITNGRRDAIMGNPQKGGGIRLINASAPTLRNLIITDNHCVGGQAGGGGIDMDTNCDAILEDIVISNNTSTYIGGGVGMYQSDPTFTRVQIINNTSDGGGGGMYIWDAAGSFRWCVIADNETGGGAPGGGGVLVHDSNPSFTQCTIANNTAPANTGGGFGAETGGNVNLNTCILWGNSDHEIYTSVADFTTNYLLVDPLDDETFETGGGNISVMNWVNGTPDFVDGGSGDYHLEFGSDAINTGHPVLDNDPDDTRADIGAFYWSHIHPVEVEVIYPNGGEPLISGEDYTITWTAASDYFDIEESDVYYTTDNGGTWDWIGSTVDDVFEIEWTAPDLFSLYCYIKVECTDEWDNEGEDLSDTRFYVGPDFVENEYIPGHYLLCTPITPDDNSLEASFGDDFNDNWIMWGFTMAGNYFRTEEVEIGHGYFLFHNPDTVNLDIDGMYHYQNWEFETEFTWNLLANPFPGDLDLDDLVIHHDGNEYTLAQAAANELAIPALYNLGAPDEGYLVANELSMWKGFWLCLLDSNITVSIYPSAPNPGPAPPIDDADQGYPEDWRLNFTASTQTNIDRLTTIGASANATDGYDMALDLPEPPGNPQGQAVKAYFEHPGWSEIVGTAFSCDVRAPLGDEIGEWELVIETAEPQDVTVTWEEIMFTYVEGYNYRLIDENTGRIVNLLTSDSHRVSVGNEPYRLIVQVSTQHLKAEPIGQTIPQAFEIISVSPNPFNNILQIKYSLLGSSAASLKVLDMQGRKIADLSTGETAAGEYTTSWNATNITSGVYIVQLDNGGYVSSRKVILMK